MQSKFKSVTSRAANLSLALILLSLTAAGPAYGHGTGMRATMAAPVREQSGYWAQVVARDATVRSRPGGAVIATITGGQWFHVYSDYRGNPSWLLGYMCPRGNRGCGSGSSIAGFVLRSALSGPRAAAPAGSPVKANELLAALKASDDTYTVGDVRSIPVLVNAAAPVYFYASEQGGQRRICSDDAWLRNDKLHPIELLRRNEVVYVERFTDGSREDGKQRWAIIRARSIRGRVLASSLCR
jgi:hypothetical protein